MKLRGLKAHGSLKCVESEIPTRLHPQPLGRSFKASG